MKYYNQGNYGNISYPAPGYEKVTVKSGGCGVCSASMIVENLTGKAFPPPTSADYAVKHGARLPCGTDMKRLGACIARDYEVTCSQSNDENALISCLNQGGMAIALVGGNRKGYTGVFSDGGHYIVVAKAENDRLTILDPGKYAGKFNKKGRAGKVTVKGDLCFCYVDILVQDALNQSPRFYLFNKKPIEKKEEAEEMTQEQFNKMFDIAMERYHEKQADKPVSAWAGAAWDKAKNAGVLDGTKPNMTVTREQMASMLVKAGVIK